MVRKFDRELKLEAMRMASEEGSAAVEVEQRIEEGVAVHGGRPRQARRHHHHAGLGQDAKTLVAGEHGSCGRIHEQGVPMNHGKPLVASSCRINDPMFLYVSASGQSLG